MYLYVSLCIPMCHLSSCNQVATSNDWSVPNSGEKRSTRCSGGKIGGTWICVMTLVQTTCFQHVRSEVRRTDSFPSSCCGYWRNTPSCCKSKGLVHFCRTFSVFRLSGHSSDSLISQETSQFVSRLATLAGGRRPPTHEPSICIMRWDASPGISKMLEGRRSKTIKRHKYKNSVYIYNSIYIYICVCEVI